ncbi:MAG: hypothetical protein EOP66_10190 [Sphingomonas sp.]|nr:MAG: hypothetical protein EOP66_10190 [Sphingomonas sp.]
MNDMSAVIVAKSDQWNADDFAAGARTFVVEDVSIKPGTEQPVQIKLAGSDKVFRPCKTVSRILVAAWGADANLYRGRSLTLFTDPGVTWGGMKVGGIRVSHMSDLSQPLVIALQEKKGSRKMTTVQPLKVQAPADQLTVEDAEQSLRSAADLDALKLAWASKAMRPFRERLQSVLDERKAALTPPSNDTDDLIASFERVTTADELAAATKAMHGLDLGDDADVQMAREAAQERVA